MLTSVRDPAFWSVRVARMSAATCGTKSSSPDIASLIRISRRGLPTVGRRSGARRIAPLTRAQTLLSLRQLLFALGDRQFIECVERVSEAERIEAAEHLQAGLQQ